MPQGAKLAAECFAENLQLFANNQTQPEKYNLYNGLRALSEELEAVSLRLHAVDTKLDLIIQTLSRSR
jgi:hypothetical protein